MLPSPCDRLGDVSDGDVESDYSEGNGQPQEKGNDPVHVVPMQDQGSDPPSGEQTLDEGVGENTLVSSQAGEPTGTIVPLRVGGSKLVNGWSGTDVHVTLAVLLSIAKLVIRALRRGRAVDNRRRAVEGVGSRVRVRYLTIEVWV